MTIVGIDPGLSGAAAFFDIKTGKLPVCDLPVLNVARGESARRDLDGHALSRLAAPRSLLPRAGASTTWSGC